MLRPKVKSVAGPGSRFRRQRPGAAPKIAAGTTSIWSTECADCYRRACLHCLLSALPARAQTAEEFYKGKTINIVIGFSVGGGYDLYARHLARYIGKHIPGNPNVVPQNMPGAGSLKAANYIFTAAPKDGTYFGTFARTTGINPLLDSGAKFDRGSSPGSAASPTTSGPASPGTPRR